jgi:hypothetical protein
MLHRLDRPNALQVNSRTPDAHWHIREDARRKWSRRLLMPFTAVSLFFTSSLRHIDRYASRLVALKAALPALVSRCDAGHNAKAANQIRCILAGWDGELNAEENSHAQDQFVCRCRRCVGPDRYRNMDWCPNINSDRRACWFERQTISDDDGCEGSAYFAL